MKILIALHQVMDLGGIIDHTEQLIGGLQDLGHTVHLKELIWSNNAHAQRKSGDWKIGPSGIPHDQGKGWNFDRRDRLAYRGAANLNSARQIMEGYDFIIWTVPVPSKNKPNQGNHDWPALYDIDVPQIAFIHDGNAKKGVPHIKHIEHNLRGVACVHHCALKGSDHLEIPRALILNPQEQPLRNFPAWQNKKPGFVNMQTFKAWKHAHELIEAIAYMPPKGYEELREVAGEGIEYRYMVSEEKCKPAYFHDQNDEWFSSWKFWDAALGNDMTHHGYWNKDEVDQMLLQARCLVDPSWSRSYSQVGGHYNRVVVDAMMRGAIPVARRSGMGDELFQAGLHYVEIPENADPKEYADVVLSVGNMGPAEADRYQQKHEEILPRFDRRYVAKQVLSLGFKGAYSGSFTDWAAEYYAVSDNKDAQDAAADKSEDILFNHFGILA